MTDEFIDILDKNGKPTGEIRLKSEAHRLGLYHASVHIWFYTKKGEILIQKRAKSKDTFPGLWDISVAGHIGAGESAENSAIRETKEEIGLSISKNDLEFIGHYMAKKTPTPYIHDNELHYIYLAKLSYSITTLTPQEEEVSDLVLIHLETLRNNVQNPEQNKNYVPHEENYFGFIFEEIQNRL